MRAEPAEGDAQWMLAPELALAVIRGSLSLKSSFIPQHGGENRLGGMQEQPFPSLAAGLGVASHRMGGKGWLYDSFSI